MDGYGWMGKSTYRWIGGQIGGETVDGWVDGWTDGEISGWMARQLRWMH